MSATRKLHPRVKRGAKPGSRWVKAAKEAGAAAALAALPILIKSLSEALPKKSPQTAPQRKPLTASKDDGSPSREPSGGKKR